MSYYQLKGQTVHVEQYNAAITQANGALIDAKWRIIKLLYEYGPLFDDEATDHLQAALRHIEDIKPIEHQPDHKAHADD